MRIGIKCAISLGAELIVGALRQLEPPPPDRKGQRFISKRIHAAMFNNRRDTFKTIENMPSYFLLNGTWFIPEPEEGGSPFDGPST